MADFITTYTGIHFYPMVPSPDALDIRDIAHALPLICRGNGHVKQFFSVGQHCVRAAKEAKLRGLSDSMALACLLHDASECYMSDVPRPFKLQMQTYRELEDRLLSMIYEKFLGADLTEEEAQQLKTIDNDLLYYDLKELLDETPAGDPPVMHIDLSYREERPSEVEKEYLSLYEELSGHAEVEAADAVLGHKTTVQDRNLADGSTSKAVEQACVIEVTDIHIPELAIYTTLNENQLVHYYEPDLGLFIAESPNVIERAFNAGYEPVSFLMDRKQYEGPMRALVERAIAAYGLVSNDQAANAMAAQADSERELPIYIAEESVLKQITGYPMTRGALCAFRRKAQRSVEEVCADYSRVLILEDVMNPTNVGAIFRSAAALGMEAVLLTAACSDPLYRRASRVSMGTVFQVPWTYIEDMETGNQAEQPLTISDRMHALGFKTVAMALCDDSINIDDPNLLAEPKLAVIMGTEGDGLKKNTIAKADYTVRIPMMHGVDSLNVAAAGAVACFVLGVR